VDLLPYVKEIEFPMRSLNIGKIIGEGAFGEVRIGTAKKILPCEKETIVAVKKLRSNVNPG
jgi:hypothetical protein